MLRGGEGDGGTTRGVGVRRGGVGRSGGGRGRSKGGGASGGRGRGGRGEQGGVSGGGGTGAGAVRRARTGEGSVGRPPPPAGLATEQGVRSAGASAVGGLRAGAGPVRAGVSSACGGRGRRGRGRSKEGADRRGEGRTGLATEQRNWLPNRGAGLKWALARGRSADVAGTGAIAGGGQAHQARCGLEREAGAARARGWCRPSSRERAGPPGPVRARARGRGGAGAAFSGGGPVRGPRGVWRGRGRRRS